ncbi:YhcH/YjgK/YiaL family protein [Gelidibacter sp. F2691]|uniref:YhcH/YjgK/YiaL family protein n=1 Tax=uncultured Gelidibacter sp. TaxID=259318 RepID=UPI001FF30845|nr:YhcH/YjgK/YiaL family protein [uncultured Gelidibacter sp.]MCK0123828.1 YhcH/YjgK/YiaL family protein [Gelidibacter sp. F2691]
MIVDKIENIGLYKGLHKGIDKALAYIKNTNFDALPVGKHEIDGDAVFAILKEYPTKPIEDQLMESHIKYIDVQYVIEGVEHMGVTMKSGQDPKKAYDPEDDYMLFEEPYDIITVKAGMYAIFFPDDIHMPEVTTGAPSNVKKVVVKVKIQNS